MTKTKYILLIAGGAILAAGAILLLTDMFFMVISKPQVSPLEQKFNDELNDKLKEASKSIDIGQIKNIEIPNYLNADACLMCCSYTYDSKTFYMDLIRNNVPDIVAKRVSMFTNEQEGVYLYFLKNDKILGSAHSRLANSGHTVFFTKIGESISFSIQLDHKLAEAIKNDPNILITPETGLDYLTNPKYSKPIEIFKIE